MPNTFAMSSAALTKLLVITPTAGVPTRSLLIASCKLHDEQLPQSPRPLMAKSDYFFLIFIYHTIKIHNNYCQLLLCGVQYYNCAVHSIHRGYMSEKLEAMRLELRRGILILAVLNALKQEQYGYSLRKALQAVDIDIEEGTLYPLVRRLESYGLLDSRWSSEEGRKRRYYQTSPNGIETLLALQTDWQQLNKSLAKISEANK